MKKLVQSTMLVIALAGFAATAAQAGVKVEICHVPPGNPANFHSITVSEKALPAHLAHGDLAGSCFASCDMLCDDGDACTIDACDETETCLVDHPQVDCDDSLLCTTDNCDPTDGCQYAAIVCNDGDECTVDMCNPMDDRRRREQLRVAQLHAQRVDQKHQRTGVGLVHVDRRRRNRGARGRDGAGIGGGCRGVEGDAQA